MADEKLGKPEVLEMLNAARAAELTAILQYMNHHYELEDQNFGPLAKFLKDIGIAEMKHAERLAERILFLGGVPIYKPDGEVKKGQKIGDMMETDRALERKAIKMYNDSAKKCADLGDHVSKDLFESLLADEEEHWDTFDNTKGHIDELGAAYLANQTGMGGD